MGLPRSTTRRPRRVPTPRKHASREPGLATGMPRGRGPRLASALTAKRTPPPGEPGGGEAAPRGRAPPPPPAPTAKRTPTPGAPDGAEAHPRVVAARAGRGGGAAILRG